jgi:membrane protease YdiL (CAAX protease family)
MNPAAVYPVPPTFQAAFWILAIALSVGLPLYVLLLRPIRGQVTWGLSEMVAMTALFLLALPLAASLLGVGMPFSLRDLSIVALIQNVLLAGLPTYIVVSRYRLPASSLGIQARDARRLAIAGIGAGIFAILLSAAGERAAVFILGLIEGHEQAALRAISEHLMDPLLPIINTLVGAAPVAWVFFLLCVIVPIGEEVFFRGFVYGGLRRRWGVAAALVVSSLFFSVVHLKLVHGFSIFLLAVIFALVYERTGSLVPPIVAHAVNNLIAVLSMWRDWGL